MEEYQETDQEKVQQQYDGQPDLQTNIETEKRLRTLTEKKRNKSMFKAYKIIIRNWHY